MSKWLSDKELDDQIKQIKEEPVSGGNDYLTILEELKLARAVVAKGRIINGYLKPLTLGKRSYGIEFNKAIEAYLAAQDNP